MSILKIFELRAACLWHIFVQLCLSVRLERSAAYPGMPGGPKGTPAGRAWRARSKSVSRRGPEGTTAAAGRQGVLEGVKGGDASPQKKLVKKMFSRKISPKAASGCWRGGDGGRSPPKKNTGREAPHNYLVILTLMKFFVAISCCNCINFLLNNLHGLHTNFCRNFIHTLHVDLYLYVDSVPD